MAQSEKAMAKTLAQAGKTIDRFQALLDARFGRVEGQLANPGREKDAPQTLMGLQPLPPGMVAVVDSSLVMGKEAYILWK